jgi:type IV secretion system protein VirB10
MSQQDRMPFEPTPPAEDAIPGLAATRKAGGKGNAKAIVGVVAVLVSMAAVGGYVVHRKMEARKAQQEPQKSEDVASANAPRLMLREGRGEAARSDQPVNAASVRGGTGEPVFEGDQKAPEGRVGTKVPALSDDGESQAIPVVRNGTKHPSGRQGTLPPNPMDAPVFANQARSTAQRGAARPNTTAGSAEGDNSGGDAHEAAYRQRVAGLLQRKAELEAQMARSQGGSSTGDVGMGPPAGFVSNAQGNAADSEAPTSGRLLGSMEKSATPRVFAQQPIPRSLTVPKGTIFQCALKTRVVTATSGFVSCLVQRDVYSHDGKIVLVDRGSHLDGEYRMLSVKPGLTRIPVMWTRLLMPNGVPVDLESPAVGQLGESGIGGHVDNRWVERIGAALLISMVDDTLKIAARPRGEGDSTVYLPSTTEQGSKIAEEVLKTTVNIPPLLYQNQGSVVGVYVARDLDFSRVYRLVPQ